MKNYFKILEIDPGASPEVIEKAYRVLCAKYHPDRQPEEHRKWANKKMQELNEAYHTLSNLERRKRYQERLGLDLWEIFLDEGLIGLAKLWIGRS